MPKARAGYERRLFIGAAGGTAANQVTTGVTDVNVNKTKTRTETTDRGDGSEIPRTHQQVVARGADISFVVRYIDGDADHTTLIAAAETGEAIAILIDRYDGGPVEFDGDVTLDMDSPGALAAGQDLTFTAVPTEEFGRKWSDS